MNLNAIISNCNLTTSTQNNNKKLNLIDKSSLRDSSNSFHPYHHRYHHRNMRIVLNSNKTKKSNIQKMIFDIQETIEITSKRLEMNRQILKSKQIELANSIGSQHQSSSDDNMLYIQLKNIALKTDIDGLTSLIVIDQESVASSMKKCSIHGQELIKLIFVPTPFGVYCNECSSPLQNEVVTTITNFMLKNHIDKNHKEMKGDKFPHSFLLHMAQDLSMKISELQNQKEKYIIKNEQGCNKIFRLQYCPTHSKLYEARKKHKCTALDLVYEVDAFLTICNRYVLSTILVDEVNSSSQLISPQNMDEEMDEEMDVDEDSVKIVPTSHPIKIILNHTIKFAPEDSRVRFSIVPLQTLIDDGHNTIKDYLISNSKSLKKAMSPLQGNYRQDRKNLPIFDIDENKLGSKDAINKCEACKEAIKLMKQYGYCFDDYNLKWSFLWSKKNSKPQGVFHYDYNPDSTTKSARVRGIKKGFGASCIIAINEFSLDYISNGFVKTVFVPQGCAIFFTDKFYHRGAANNSSSEAWRVFLYAFPSHITVDGTEIYKSNDFKVVPPDLYLKDVV